MHALYQAAIGNPRREKKKEEAAAGGEDGEPQEKPLQKPRLAKQATFGEAGYVIKRHKNQTKKEDDYATIRIRGNRRGKDFTGPQITRTGWWTLGMSVTPDGMVHYYASPGVDDLTEDDYITSQFPYDYKAERFRTFFYNICSANDGKRWSTAFVVDDPKVFVLRPASKLATKPSESAQR